jgi:metal-responsive CopG/Arc/MetJ family transcriptional regulator
MGMGKRGPKGKYPAFIACALPEKLAAEIKAYARRHKITVSEAIRRLIREGLNGGKTEKKPS